MDIAFNLLIVGLAVVWLALVFWTWSDARRRVEDRFLVLCATAGALFPFIGSLVWMIVRPPELLEDVRERDLEIAASEARLARERIHSCPHCDEPTEPDFLRCPSCLRSLREPCPSCSRAVDPKWRICPFCEAQPGASGSAAEAPAPRRRRASASAGSDERPATKKRAASGSATSKAAAKRRTSPATDAADADRSSSTESRAKARGADGSAEPDQAV